MKYSTRINSVSCEESKIFDSISSAIDFISAADIKENFEIWAEDINFYDDSIPDFLIYTNGKGWDLYNVLVAFNIETAELYRDFDEYEFRNSWSLEDFYAELLSFSELIEVCSNLLHSLNGYEDFEKELAERCYNCKKAISHLYIYNNF